MFAVYRKVDASTEEERFLNITRCPIVEANGLPARFLQLLSYRLAVVSIKKSYPGHARRVMFGIWSFLRQFMYTKFIIVVDDDVNIRDWKEVIWAMTTRVDPTRDTLLVDSTPIDYLDFASPVSGLGSKMGLDATNKWPGETSREWGKPLQMDAAVTAKVEQLWQTLGL